MVVCFVENLDPSGPHKSLERLECFRRELLHLLESYSRDRERTFEPGMRVQKIEKDPVGLSIAFCRYFMEDLFVIQISVGPVVEIFMIMPDIEHAVVFDPIRLVHLKIEAD
jgi:hypothetical protein